MSKKQKQCQGRDTFHRMNYLHQASKLMAGRNNFLSSYFGHQCRAIGRKSVLKMEPAVKRTMCKKCLVFLKPGETADVDIEDSGQEVCVITCKRCGFRKRYHNDKNYSMWLDNPASVAECLNFSSDGASSSKGQLQPTPNGCVSPKDTKDHKNVHEKEKKKIAHTFPKCSSTEEVHVEISTCLPCEAKNL